MSFNSTTLLKLAALKLDPDQMAGVVEILADYEAAEEARKIAQRDRARKSRASRDGNMTVTHVERDVPRAGVTLVEDKLLTQKIEPQESKKQNTAARDVAEFKAKLSPFLEADLLNAFVAVRKTKRGALTGYAAGLFIGDAEKCGMSVPDAAKECVRSSWITVKLEYFGGRPRASPASVVAPSQAEVFAAIARKANHENQPGSSEDRNSLRPAIPHLSAVRAG